jgi:hypothetical protein
VTGRQNRLEWKKFPERKFPLANWQRFVVGTSCSSLRGVANSGPRRLGLDTPSCAGSWVVTCSFWRERPGRAVVRLFGPNLLKRADAPMSTHHDDFVPTISQKESEQRDKLLLALLKTPPQPRPKRVRAKAKSVPKVRGDQARK